MSSNESLESFGKEIIGRVYDDSLSHLKRVMEGKMKGKRRMDLGALYKSLDDHAAEAVRRFAAEAVDATFSRFLNFFDEQGIPLYFPSSAGKLVDVRTLSDGLAAEPYTDSGWIARYAAYKDLIDPLK